MAFNINPALQNPYRPYADSLHEQAFQEDSPTDFPSPLQNDLPSFFSNIEQDDSEIGEKPLWDGIELSGQEVADFFQSTKEGKLSLKESDHLQPKRGRWSNHDVAFLCSYVEKASQSKEEKIQEVWDRVSKILQRNPDDCKKRYFKYLEERPPVKREESFPKKQKTPFTERDVQICELVIKQFNLIRADGLLDMKRLSEHTDRAYSSLRYNIYLASDSVFSTNPFFTPFRQKYREIHKLVS